MPESLTASPAASSPGQQSGLIVTLAFLSGLVDVTGWMSFGGLFTAHVTGNLVLLAAGVGTSDPSGLARSLAVPVFALTVALGHLAAGRAAARGSRLALLLGQTVLLAGVLLVLLLAEPRGGSPGLVLLAAMAAVAAMGVQCAFVRGALDRSQGTSYMTGHLITLALSAAALVRPGPWTREEARERLRRTWPILVAFLAGCPLAALSVEHLGPIWAWVVPVAASLLPFPLVGSGEPASSVRRSGGKGVRPEEPADEEQDSHRRRSDEQQQQRLSERQTERGREQHAADDRAPRGPDDEREHLHLTTSGPPLGPLSRAHHRARCGC